jgi:hypothetical protein
MGSPQKLFRQRPAKVFTSQGYHLIFVVTRIEVWFHHEPYGTRTRCKFAQALVWVREDVALVYLSVRNPQQ